MKYKRIWISCGIVFLTLISAAAFLVSETGLRWIIKTAGQQIEGTLEIRAVHGSLLGPISLEGIRYQSAQNEIDSERIAIEWSPAALLKARLHIKQIHVSGLSISTSPVKPEPSTDKEPTPEFSGFSIPLAVQLDDFQITQIVYQDAQGKQTPADSISLSAQTHKDKLIVQKLEILSPQGKLTASGLIKPNDLSVELDTAWRLNLEELPVFEGSGKLTGNLMQASLNQNLTLPAKISLNATFYDLMKNPRWQGDVRFDALNPRVIRDDLPDLSLTSQIKGQGDLSRLQVNMKLQTRVEQYGDIKIDSTISGAYASPWEIKGFSLLLPEHDMRISATGNLAIKDNLPVYSLATHWENLAWPIQDAAMVKSPRGQAQISGTGMQYRVVSQGDIEIKDLPAGKLSLSGQGTDESFSLESATLSALQSRISASGDVTWKQANKQGIEALTYKLDAQWQDLTWPLNATPVINSPTGRVEITGAAMNYQATLKADVAGKDMPPGQISISGNGNQEAFDFHSADLNTLNGNVHGQGKIRWLPEITWQTNLKARDIDPSVRWSEWQGKLNAELVSQGSFNNQQLASIIDIKQLSGDLRGYPVEARAKLEIDNQHFNLPELLWRSGTAQITAHGKLDEQWQMEWSAHADDMAALYPELSGQFSASGKLSGARTQPRLTASLSGSEIALREIKLGELTGNIQLDATDRTPTHINLQLKNLRMHDWSVDSVQLTTEGILAKHQWQIAIARGEETLDLELDGGYQALAWQGDLNTLKLATTQAGTWTLEEPVHLLLSPDKAKNTNLCLRSGESRLCIEADWQAAGDSNIKSVFTGLSTSLIAAFIPQEFSWRDSLSGQLDASIDANKNLHINSNMQLGPGSVTFSETEEEILKLEYQNIEITAQTDNNGTQLTLKTVLNQTDQINADFRLPGYSRLSAINGGEPITGRITGSYRNLELISLFVPTVQDISGLVSLDIALAGSLGNPLITGTGTLSDGQVSIPDAGLKLTETKLELTSDGGNTLLVTGSSRSGNGTVSLSGDLTLDAQADWSVHLELKGNDFEVLRRPGQWILASPDIKVDIKDKQINVQGTVAIPRTDIELKAIPETIITASSDVVITQKLDTPAVANGKGWTILTELRLLPGENVRFSGFGLSGRAQGDLTLIKALGKTIVGTGNLEIIEGKYRAFGTELSIEQGQLIFANSPVDNPGIDLRAQRTIETDTGKIVVGLHAQGRLKAATLTLFSEPSMDETNVLSYLLLGRPASERSDSDSGLLVAAAAAIGTSEAFVAAKRLAQSLGFEDAQVNRNGMVLGKSLSPRLYLSYEIGLLQPQNTLQLRYKLTDRWTAKVKTGEYDSTDLIFTIER